MKKLFNALFICLAVLSSCVGKEEPMGPEPEETPVDTLNTEGKYNSIND